MEAPQPPQLLELALDVGKAKKENFAASSVTNVPLMIFDFALMNPAEPTCIWAAKAEPRQAARKSDAVNEKAILL